MAVEPRADHAQYLAHWLKVLKADKRAIFTAASRLVRPYPSCGVGSATVEHSPKLLLRGRRLGKVNPR
ncbi:zincin-like metallopeptidase domain-containing protein [Bradyrhizobium sp. DASA03007]|uniref:zincin-like metallopeptidase domain-containing protein n=1 Tax=unclassified Bradyrhizobium TaxID=2631580 RepID=UPI003F71C829